MRLNDYIGRSRRRAQRKKSYWNVVLFAMVWPLTLLSLWCLFLLVSAVQRQIAPQKRINQNMTNLGEILMVTPLCLPSIVIALLAANCLIWLVKPARDTLDREAAKYAGVQFRTACEGLAYVAIVLLALTLPISIIGAIDPF